MVVKSAMLILLNKNPILFYYLRIDEATQPEKGEYTKPKKVKFLQNKHKQICLLF